MVCGYMHQSDRDLDLEIRSNILLQIIADIVFLSHRYRFLSQLYCKIMYFKNHLKNNNFVPEI